MEKNIGMPIFGKTMIGIIVHICGRLDLHVAVFQSLRRKRGKPGEATIIPNQRECAAALIIDNAI